MEKDQPSYIYRRN